MPCPLEHIDSYQRGIESTLSSGELGTIQFAVEALQVKHIVVCGHTDCGAVKAMMNPQTVESLPHLKQWVKIASKGLHLSAEDSVKINVRLNALNQIRRLESLDFVQERVEAKKAFPPCVGA